MTSVSLVERINNILRSPRDEWPVIAGESSTAKSLYTTYILPVSAIPAVATFLKVSAIGTGMPLSDAQFRVGIGAGLANAVFQYGIGLVSVYLLSLIINALAPRFGGTRDPIQALKTVAYAYTASWIAGTGIILPWIGWLLSLAGGIYAVYLLYLAMPVTMRCANDKAMAYTLTTVVCAVVMSIVIGIISVRVSGGLFSGLGSDDSSITITSGEEAAKTDPDSTLGKLEQMSKRMEAAGQKMEAAQKSGDTQAQNQALGEVMGAMLGGGQNVQSLAPEQIKPFIPAELGGMPRTRYNVERNAMLGLQVSSGKASYANSSGEHRLDLEITDMGGARGLAMLAGWAQVETESESDTGYERVYHDNGARVHEKWDAASESGSYELIVADRFLVHVQGSGVDMKALKKAAASLDLSGLAKLKDAGVQPG
ncbi:MAG: Yip1 family protein [Panacagrimonas sp.]